MGGLTRSQGKSAVLALGFIGGANSLKAMAGDRDFISVDGEQVLIRSAPDEVLFNELVYPWRDANKRIVQLWKGLDLRFRTGGPVGEHLAFEKHGKDRLLRLPSGRAICYRSCSIRRDQEGRERLTFASPQGFRVDTYGGRLAENVTQAVARDIMAEALVRLEERGYPVVAHVHDEILVEGEHDLDEVRAVICESPSWATGLPISGSGFSTYRYKKD
jgi:DNA polymerase